MQKEVGMADDEAGSKLGLPEKDFVDVLNVKSDPMLITSLRGQEGYFPAYHMNKEKWISILLREADLDDSIRNLLALSFELTAPKRKKSQIGKRADLLAE